MSAWPANMPVQRRGMGPHRIAYLARTDGRSGAAVDGHQPQSRGRRRRLRLYGARANLPTATHLPLMANSDHANFAAHGIPAVRLIAGFDAPDSNLRLVLTAADTRDKVQPEELDQALRIATTLTWQALGAADATLLSLAATGRS